LKLIAELKLTYHCKSLDTDEGKKLCSMRKKLNAVEVMLVTGANLMNKDCGKRENEFTTKDMVRDYIIIIDKMRNENNGFYAFLGKSKYYNFSKLKRFEEDNKSLNACLMGLRKAFIWYSMNSLEIEDDLDLHYIWILSKIVEDSQVGEIYKLINEFYIYLYGYVNVVGDLQHIYNLVFENLGISDYELDYIQIEQIKSLILENYQRQKVNEKFYRKTKDNRSLDGEYIEENPDLAFFKKVNLFEFNYRATDLINLTVDEVSQNNYNFELRERQIISSYEVASTLTNNLGVAERVNQRMSKEYFGKDYIPLRDRIDYNSTVNDLHKHYNEMFEKNSTDTRKVLSHHFYMLLYKMNNETRNDFVDLENENGTNFKIRDPFYFSTAYLNKEYHTTMGSIHMFRREMLSSTRKPPEYLVDGLIPDAYAEIKVEFYEEMKILVEIFCEKFKYFHEKISSITKDVVNFPVVNNHVSDFNFYMSYAIRRVQGVIEDQLNEVVRRTPGSSLLTDMIYPDWVQKKWVGWYSYLYFLNKDGAFHGFETKSYFSRMKVSFPKQESGYKGSIHYSIFKNYSFGVAIVLDEKKPKIMVYSRFETEDIYKAPGKYLTEQSNSSK
jgi:hypothetical protein